MRKKSPATAAWTHSKGKKDFKVWTNAFLSGPTASEDQKGRTDATFSPDGWIRGLGHTLPHTQMKDGSPPSLSVAAVI